MPPYTCANWPQDAGSNDSWLFVHKPQLARSHANATQPAPYSPGGTTLITGDKVATGSVNADRMNTASFAATGLALFGGAVRSTNFVSGTRGWRIDNNGSMELQNLVARDWVQVGAVSEGVTYTNASSRAVNNGQDVTVASTGALCIGPILANRNARPGGATGENSGDWSWNGSDESYVYENARRTNAAGMLESVTDQEVGGPWQNQHSSRLVRQHLVAWKGTDVVHRKTGRAMTMCRCACAWKQESGARGSARRTPISTTIDDVSIVARALVR